MLKMISRLIGNLTKRDFWRKAMNREKEMIERNIELSAEFSRYLFKRSGGSGLVSCKAQNKRKG
jgi:hypothetical protein